MATTLKKKKRKEKKTLVFECYVAILFLNIFEKFYRVLGGGWSKWKRKLIKKGKICIKYLF